MPSHLLPVRRPGPRIAAASLFFLTGLYAGGYVSRIPALTSRLDLDVGQIGSVLFCFSLGAITVFPVVGKVVARLGSRRTAYLTSVGAAFCFMLLAVAPSTIVFGLTLYGAGLAFGMLNVALNTQGVAIERYLGRSLLSGFHGWFTLGMLLGSLLGGLAARIGLGPLPQFVASAAFGITLVTTVVPGLLPDPPVVDQAREAAERRSGLLPRTLWPVALLAFCASMPAGSMYDWSALYVHENLGQSEAIGALAFAAFALAELTGRFSGDRVVTRLGAVAVTRLGSLLAGVGLLTGLALDVLPPVVIGFAAIGLGGSVLVPLFYSTVGSIPGVASAQGVAVVATFGMLGLLAGPPVLGTVGDLTSLRLALALVAIPLSVIFLMAPQVRPKAPHAAPTAIAVADVPAA
jgi:MFS family permease